MGVAGGFIVVVGYAMVLNMMSVSYLMPFFYLGFVLGGYGSLSLLSWGVVGLILAIVYVQLNPKFSRSSLAVATTSGASVAADELED